MNARIGKKVANFIYKKVLSGNFAEANARLNKMSADKQRKILTLFNSKSFESLGTDSGADLITNFAARRGYQKGMRQLGGPKGIADTICESMNLQLSRTLETASTQAIESLPKNMYGWIKLLYREKVSSIKSRIAKCFNNIECNYLVKKVRIGTKATKTIPEEIKGIFTGLTDKSGQEFAETAYLNMVNHMKLSKVAPKSISIKGGDGLMNVTGGYNPVTNSIEYSEGFLTKLSREQQINLISHELKHCEQFTNMIRTEGIGIEEYARAIAENNIRNAIKESSLSNIMFRMQYKKALENGNSEEFIQKAIEKSTEKLIPELKVNFAEILNMPKIKADSPEGIKAYKHLEAQRNYEGLDFLGLGGEHYKNNLLEVEAYAFGSKIEGIFKEFMS